MKLHHPQKFHVLPFSQYISSTPGSRQLLMGFLYRLDLHFLEVHINVTILHIFFSVPTSLTQHNNLWFTQVCIIVFLLLSSVSLCFYTTVCLYYIYLLKFILWGEGLYWEECLRSDKICHILIRVFLKVYQTIHLRSPCFSVCKLYNNKKGDVFQIVKRNSLLSVASSKTSNSQFLCTFAI